MIAIPEPEMLELDWTDACARSQIPLAGGVNVLVQGEQVAVFRARDGRLFAVSNFDPFSRANVLSRGIVGSTVRDGRHVYKVASPLLKHTFDLETGQSLDDPAVRLRVYALRLEGDRVLIGTRPR